MNGLRHYTLALALCLSTLDMAAASRLNPVEKTVELITKLQMSITKDGEVAQAAYQKYFEWCDDASTEKRFEVKSATKEKAKLEAEIQRTTSEADAASVKIEELAKMISENEKKLKDTTDVRKAEAASFKDSEAKLMESIDMLGRAIEILEKEAAKGGASLMQKTVATSSLETVLVGLSAVIDAAGIPTEDTQKLAALIQDSEEADDGDDMLGPPQGKAYQSHSNSIVEVMEDMREKAEVQLRKSRAQEKSAQQNYELLKQNLDDQISNANKDMKDEKENLAASNEKKATAEGDLAVTVKELAQSSKNLKQVQDACIEAAADHEVSVRGRAAELAALAQAKKTIQQAMGGASKAYAFMQVSSKAQSTSRLRSTSMAMRRTAANVAAGKQVIVMVKQLAERQKSSSLAQLASRLNAVVRYGAANGEDPFKNVKALITDMIKRLEDEATADAKEKAYCDAEMKKTGEHSEELTDDVEGLKSKIDQAAAASARLKGQVKELNTELADLQKQQAKMDQARETEHNTYTSAKADLEQGLEGTRTAIRLLREYYAADDDSDEASLLQSDESIGEEMRQPTPPEKYEKSSGAGAGIIGLLEVCESDIAKNLAEIETEEASAQTEYDKLKQENKVLKALKEKDVEYKTREIKSLGSTMSELSSDYDDTSEELASLTEYFTRLKKRCIAKPEPYAERKARREAEIKGLQEALDILQGESASMLQQ